tara:strand:+ start:1114 stop:2241 length:1128 start_codon:yes stop_codon:yes gene_type:complete
MFRELKFRRFQFLLIFIFSTSFIISGKTNGVFIENYKDLKLELITDELEIPWGMDFLDNGDIIVTEKNGLIFRIDKNDKLIKIEGGPKSTETGQGGLLDVQLHPNFIENRWIYFSYNKKKNNKFTTAVSRFEFHNDNLKNEKLIFEALPYSNKRLHFGSRLEFDKEGYLYITVGDRGSRDINPQDLSRHAGKVHRIYDNGDIPKDNPFYDKKNAIKSIFSYGHRNPQGMILNPFTNEIWTHEHGPRGGDEINIINKGLNYGWPVITYGINYSGTIITNEKKKEGMEQPLHYWVPSIAPSGMVFIEGSLYPSLNGNLLIGSLKFEYLHLCIMKGSEVISEHRLFEDMRVRNVKQRSDGYIFFSVEEPGRIYKILPN